jgi:hypothetical protein
MKIANKKARYQVSELNEFKGSNLKGVQQGKLYIVFSYNWYPLLVMDVRTGKWYENSTKYSPSTSRHLYYCKPYDIEPEKMEHKALVEMIESAC